MCNSYQVIKFIYFNYSTKTCHKVDNVTRDCNEIFKVMLHCNSDFVNHAMISSTPFTICTNNFTFVSFRYTMDFYNKMFTTFDPHNTNVVCADEFLSKNRMDVISSFISSSKTLWESANCDACYDNATSPVQNLSRNTNEFFNLSKSFDECVKNATNESNNKSYVCMECDKKYQTLNNLFQQLKKSSQNKVCFDLVDKARRTKYKYLNVSLCLIFFIFCR